MESRENGHTLMDVVLRFLQEDHWSFQLLEQQPAIRAGHRGEHGTWVCYLRVDDENQRFLFYAFMGLNIPPQHRPAVAEYLMRVNYNLTLGNFEMDFETGEVRFRASVETTEGELSVATVRSLAYTSVLAMDRYFPGVLAVVHGGLSPEAALARAEAQIIES